MKEVTLITGPLRSGTSFITGLLECCGFSLGNNVRVLRKPTEENPKGHFETDLLYTINVRLLYETKKDHLCIIEPPEKADLKALSLKRINYFRLFLRKFDGELCKDPLMCLTLPLWEPYWKELRRIVFCLRHPLAVARSIEKRYWIPVDIGFNVWKTYVTRFFNFASRCKVFIFDFDAFRKSPYFVFNTLLNWLNRPMMEGDIKCQIDKFFGSDYVHWTFDTNEQQNIPDDVWKLYIKLQSQSGMMV